MGLGCLSGSPRTKVLGSPLITQAYGLVTITGTSKINQRYAPYIPLFLLKQIDLLISDTERATSHYSVKTNRSINFLSFDKLTLKEQHLCLELLKLLKLLYGCGHCWNCQSMWVWSLLKLLKLLYVGVVSNDSMRTILGMAKGMTFKGNL